MATLSDVATNVVNKTRRSDLLTETKAEIGNAIRHYNRRASWILERRDGTIALVASTTWYSQIDNTAGAGIEGSDAPTGTTPTATDDLRDLMELTYAKLELGTVDWPLDEISFHEMQRLIENTTVTGTPRYVAHYAGQLGFWPTPGSSFTAVISGMFKPAVPTADADESVWFDQYRELIENSAARRVASLWMQDVEMAQIYGMSEKEQEGLLLAEGAMRMSTGRLRPSVGY